MFLHTYKINVLVNKTFFCSIIQIILQLPGLTIATHTLANTALKRQWCYKSFFHGGGIEVDKTQQLTNEESP